jgi:hypothetical protein
LSASLERSTHAPLQFVSGGVHDAAHPVGVHTWPGAHATLHAPHVAGECRFASHPFETRPSQSVQSVSHWRMAHLPALHVGSAFGVAHAEHVAGSPQPIDGAAVAVS